MDLMLLGWLCALLVGMSLGLCGAGGSILTVPILVYFMGVPAVDATVDSLLIVGSTAAFSAWRYYRQGHIDFPVAIAFIIPSLFSIYAVRLWLIPQLPDVLYQSSHIIVQRDDLMMLIFSVIMLWAARAMLKPAPHADSHIPQTRPWFNIGIQGILLGCLVGLVGAGGGFLIVPVLITWVGLSMTQAVGTSLLIITVNTLLGFIAGIQGGSDIDYNMILGFAALAWAGAWLGTQIACYVNDKKLKQWFAYSIIVIALLMLGENLWSMLP